MFDMKLIGSSFVLYKDYCAIYDGFEKHADDEGRLCIHILRVKNPNVCALKLCDTDCVLKNTLGDWWRTHLSLHREPDNICNKVGSKCAYDLWRR
jgi:hypothetical protein